MQNSPASSASCSAHLVLANSMNTSSQMRQHRRTWAAPILLMGLTAALLFLWGFGVHQSFGACTTHVSMKSSVREGSSSTHWQPDPIVAPALDHTAADDWPSSLHFTSWKFKGVQKPPAAEGVMSLIPVCNASWLEQHPLTAADYQRSYKPGQPCSMPPGLLKKVLSGEPVKITVVGGSMTQGRRCFDGKRTWQSCAWSSRLQDRLRETFPYGNITVHNAAMPGFSYGHWLQSGMIDSLVETDVAIIDEQVNSHQYAYNAYHQMEAVDEFLYGLLSAARRRQRHVGVLFMETFRTCANSSEVCDQLCDATHKKGRQGQFQTVIKGYNTTWHWCNRWWTTPDIERPIVRHYGLPIASYRDAVWPNMNEPRPELPCLWNGKSHPDAITHSLIGDVMAYGVIRAMMDGASHDTCPEPPVPSLFHKEMETVVYCTVPSTSNDSTPTGTFLSAFHPSEFKPLQAGTWEWREDVPGKPGWIFELGNSTSANASVTDKDMLWFTVRFSSRPQLQVTYLTTYINIASVEVTVHNLTATERFDNGTALAGYILNAHNPDAVSVPRTSLFVHPKTASNSRTRSIAFMLPAVVGEGEYVVAFRPVLDGANSKFKLLGISSC